ncbi:bifunctional alpha,alpha-trehalose-phosphate synthase (UDP-forming)/trehalose-phosphatase [Filimonas effusa]|uniref:Bifunctional alpha,alpha-trehalose-phosphate synthase (UDP-forming)/trehalose-phosphatase n=1 Tax=Filimonas effusa TaxID=2508721 RepID=A0A4Q1DA63_9BACT|nr:bifunctional alpha,alpha-trehalose-phosphate synthase (UDP-forming)/trehalose-phosphatase [Filimonas effusa]RXK86261.1 bifunctional alpha,alpha-trehalose-phosphate synthase (UDP-forming)/trehalose-phosphatase [Filimonas effusa]
MSKTIIVSNRLPVKVNITDGELSMQASEGGLATGLGSIYKEGNNVWIGWPGTEVAEEQQKHVTNQLKDLRLSPVFLTKEDILLFYEGFSNEILWPVFHYMSTYARYEDEYWESYRQVNEKFKTAILQVAEAGDTIWIHDYQLLLLAGLIRRELPNITIGFFQHIPFPSYELFRLIPWRSELLEGMLGADLVGFHTYDDARHFLSAATRILQLQSSSNIVTYNQRSVVVESFPMGIDDTKFNDLVLTNDEVRNNISHLEESFTNIRMILSIDRLDYSKGILQRLQAFDIFLQEHPEYKEKVSLYMIVVPSRDTVTQYKELRDEIDKLVGNINARFRTNTWSPVNYFYRSFPLEMLSALYSFAEICLVTPMRDGMNLVCKEYVASRTHNDGVLILSEMAGASKELIDAIIVNPNNVRQMSAALVEALNMSEDEQVRRMTQMRMLVSKYNITNWVKVFMERLEETKRLQLSLQARYIGTQTLNYIRNKYAKAHSRLILLDYDGTLVEFNSNLNMARPDKELYNILEELTRDVRNHVVIISGRNHVTLQEWFGHLKVDMVAEHGVWNRYYGSEWEDKKGLNNSWKQTVFPILNTYTERTPGSLIEEKSYSLVWHYRKAEKELGEMRASEMINNLRYMAADLGLHLLPGNKVVEIKNVEVNKGKSAQQYLHNGNYDFVMAIGDDNTDEDMFKALKPDAISIKVNSSISAARFYLRDVREVREFLKGLPNKLLITKMIDRVLNWIPNVPFTIKKK